MGGTKSKPSYTSSSNNYYSRPSYSRNYNNGGYSDDSWNQYRGHSEYRVNVIDDMNLNKILRRHFVAMNDGDRSLLRQAQFMASNELSRVMRNCELRIYLSNFHITIRSGDCTNIIQATKSYRGEIQWKFIKRGFLQTAWDLGRGFASLVGNFAARFVAPIASSIATGYIAWL